MFKLSAAHILLILAIISRPFIYNAAQLHHDFDTIIYVGKYDTINLIRHLAVQNDQPS